MRLFLLSFLLFLCCSLALPAQDTVKHYLPARIVQGDTLPTLDLGGVTVFPMTTRDYSRNLVRYDRLVYNIRIVYPYARLAGMKLKQIKAGLDTLTNEKQRRHFIRKSENELEAQFGNQVRDLTYSQGKILIKLIYRETGASTFQIVRELKGGFSAFLWQTMARLFGYDLKTIYDPQGDDQSVEHIVQMIESGAI